jgi:hypothetical protein
LRKPTKKQLAEFEDFWEEWKGPLLRMAYGDTEKKTKALILAHYLWLWEGAGCPRRFIPKPTDSEPVDIPTGTSDSHDQNINVLRDWNL